MTAFYFWGFFSFFRHHILKCIRQTLLLYVLCKHKQNLLSFFPDANISIVRFCIYSSTFFRLLRINLCVDFSRELFSPAQKYQLLVYHADAIFHDKEYRNAACKYSMALQQKKVLNKTSKVRTSTGGAAANIQAQVIVLFGFHLRFYIINMGNKNCSRLKLVDFQLDNSFNVGI